MVNFRDPNSKANYVTNPTIGDKFWSRWLNHLDFTKSHVLLLLMVQKSGDHQLRLVVHLPLVSALRIMGSQNWWFGDPRTLLYRFKPLYTRVQWFLGRVLTTSQVVIARFRNHQRCMSHPESNKISNLFRDGRLQNLWVFLSSLPIVSIKLAFLTYMYHKNQPNVGAYIIHGSYGLWYCILWYLWNLFH